MPDIGKNIVLALAGLCHNPQAAELVLADAKLPLAGLPVFSAMTPEQYWRAVLTELAKDSEAGVRALVAAASARYPGNAALRGGAFEAIPPPPGACHVSLGRLPSTDLSHFVRREDELARLDAAWVFGWSFYSQGVDGNASADSFFSEALEFFGWTGGPITSPWKRGETLAQLVRRSRTLLVLDGLEPLQFAPAPGATAGKLKDPGLQALLRELLAQGDGLCLISTRIPVHELGGRMGASMLDLRTLEPEAGALLLRGLGVDGTEQEMRAASEEMGGHSLALTLLGTYLRDVLRGDVRRRREVDLLSPEAEGTEHARRVMASYAAWFRGASPDATDTDVPELRVLRLLGLFDRPANAAILEALRAEPPIEGLTDGLTSTCGKTWDQIVARLRKAGLVLPADTPGAGDGGLDAHPLVRAYFGERLEKERPEAWREGEVFKEVYRRRIHRGDEFYSSKKLGAFGSELAAVSAFFVGGWEEPSAELPEAPISSSPQGVGTVPGVETPGYSRVAPPGLQKERVAAVIERATQTIEISKQNRWLLTIALDHLTLGHAHHLLNHPEAATHHLDHAVEGLRQAGHDEFVARGLLARAAYLHALGADPTPNLDEALDLAERGGMRLFAADAHLLRTRLALSTGDHPLAHRHFEKARDLVNACGYERRRSELDALEAAL